MSFFGLFRRSPPPTNYGPASAEDWGAGDIALCLHSKWHQAWTGAPAINPPTKDNFYKVEAVAFHGGVPFLALVGRPVDVWNASFFRKVRPDASEACTAEFRARVKRGAGKVSA